MIDFWTDERVSILRAMLAANHTGNEIAAALGNGCTKRAVIGKANRLGLCAQGMARFWTPDKDAVLRELHAANASFDRIAAVMGVTRKAAANRAVAIGLPGRPRHFRAADYSCANLGGFVTWDVTPRKPRPAKPRLVVTLAEPSKDLAANILDVTGCRWAITPHHVGKGDHLFCNHDTEPNKSYCEYHEAMKRGASVRVAERKRTVTPTCLLRVA